MQALCRQNFETLLRELFEVQELYRFLKALGRDFSDSLRPGLSLIELVAEVLSLVERHGCWGEFFSRLAQECSPAYERIFAVASMFDVRVAPPARSGVSLASSDTIRGLLGDSDDARTLFQ